MGLFGGFIEKFKQGLAKTKEVFTAPLKKIFSAFRKLDEATLAEIEEALITADFGAGFQLGFGFTLNAVGGLLGVNRVMLFQPLILPQLLLTAMCRRPCSSRKSPSSNTCGAERV